MELVTGRPCAQAVAEKARLEKPAENPDEFIRPMSWKRTLLQFRKEERVA